MLDNLDILIDKLTPPLYTYRMALNDTKRGSAKRIANAKQRMHEAVMEYATTYNSSHQLTEKTDS